MWLRGCGVPLTPVPGCCFLPASLTSTFQGRTDGPLLLPPPLSSARRKWNPDTTTEGLLLLRASQLAGSVQRNQSIAFIIRPRLASV